MFDFDYTFQWRSALRALPDMLAGAWVTFETAALSMIFGVLIALALTVMREGKQPLLRGFANGWVSIARNTPSLFQIYILYFGLGSLGLHVSSWIALLAGITFNNAGYLAENFRGALKAIPETQTRAGRSLGMSGLQSFRYIVMPQMLRIAFLPMTNQMVWAVLMTSLGVTVGMNTDLYGVTQDLNALTFRTFELFAIAAVIFYIITKIITLGARLIASRLFRY